MTPPVNYRPISFFFKILGPLLALSLANPYFGDTPWHMFLVAIIPGAFLGWLIGQVHDFIRYRRLGEDYYVDRLDGKVWYHGYYAPNPWDAGWYWYPANMTEQEAIDRLLNRRMDK